ncbi:MAG: sialidase family protein [Chloroflexota bacterium]
MSWLLRVPHHRLALAMLLLVGPFLVLSGGSSAVADNFAPVVRVSGPDPYAQCSPATSRGGIEYPNSAAEPSAAVDQATVGTDHVSLVGAWQQDRWSDGGAQGIVAASSRDGGLTWSETLLPFSQCAPGGLPFNRASDPWIAIGPDGTVYASAVAARAVPNGAGASLEGVEVAVSRNEGGTWSHAQLVPDSRGGGDGTRIVVDPSRSSVAYAVWTKRIQLRGGELVDAASLSESTDSGNTWSKPRDIVLKSRGHRDSGGVGLLFAPRTRTLYDLATIFRKKHGTRVCRRVKNKHRPRGHRVCRISAPAIPYKALLAVSASRDGGRRWSPERIINQIRLATKFPPVRAVGTMQVALDPESGRLYVVWEDGRFSGGNYANLAISSSKNGGETWSTPQEVPSPAGDAIFGPSLAVTTGGAVGVAYYTLPQSAKRPASAPAQYWLSISHDHARHFGHPMSLAGPFDLRRAPIQGTFLGDYQGMAAGASFYPFFVTTNPTGVTNATDVFASSVVP